MTTPTRSGMLWDQEERRVWSLYHDVPAELIAEALKRTRGQTDTPGNERWRLDEWPSVPTRFLLCRDDRFFPTDWMRKAAKERLGISVEEP